MFYECARVCRCLQRPEENIRSPGVGVPGGCERPNEDAGNQLSLLYEQQALSPTEPSLQHPRQFFQNECMPALGTVSHSLINYIPVPLH